MQKSDRKCDFWLLLTSRLDLTIKTENARVAHIFPKNYILTEFECKKNQVDPICGSASSCGSIILRFKKCKNRPFLDPTASGSTQNYSKLLFFRSEMEAVEPKT